MTIAREAVQSRVLRWVDAWWFPCADSRADAMIRLLWMKLILTSAGKSLAHLSAGRDLCSGWHIQAALGVMLTRPFLAVIDSALSA